MSIMITTGVGKSNPKHRNLFEELSKLGCNPFYFNNPKTKQREIFYYDNHILAKNVIKKYK